MSDRKVPAVVVFKHQNDDDVYFVDSPHAYPRLFPLRLLRKPGSSLEVGASLRISLPTDVETVIHDYEVCPARYSKDGKVVMQNVFIALAHGCVQEKSQYYLHAWALNVGRCVLHAEHLVNASGIDLRSGTLYRGDVVYELMPTDVRTAEFQELVGSRWVVQSDTLQIITDTTECRRFIQLFDSENSPEVDRKLPIFLRIEPKWRAQPPFVRRPTNVNFDGLGQRLREKAARYIREPVTEFLKQQALSTATSTVSSCHRENSSASSPGTHVLASDNVEQPPVVGEACPPTTSREYQHNDDSFKAPDIAALFAHSSADLARKIVESAPVPTVRGTPRELLGLVIGWNSELSEGSLVLCGKMGVKAVLGRSIVGYWLSMKFDSPEDIISSDYEVVAPPPLVRSRFVPWRAPEKEKGRIYIICVATVMRLSAEQFKVAPRPNDSELYTEHFGWIIDTTKVLPEDIRHQQQIIVEIEIEAKDSSSLPPVLKKYHGRFLGDGPLQVEEPYFPEFIESVEEFESQEKILDDCRQSSTATTSTEYFSPVSTDFGSARDSSQSTDRTSSAGSSSSSSSSHSDAKSTDEEVSEANRSNVEAAPSEEVQDQNPSDDGEISDFCMGSDEMSTVGTSSETGKREGVCADSDDVFHDAQLPLPQHHYFDAISDTELESVVPDRDADAQDIHNESQELSDMELETDSEGEEANALTASCMRSSSPTTLVDGSSQSTPTITETEQQTDPLEPQVSEPQDADSAPIDKEKEGSGKQSEAEVTTENLEPVLFEMSTVTDRPLSIEHERMNDETSKYETLAFVTFLYKDFAALQSPSVQLADGRICLKFSEVEVRETINGGSMPALAIGDWLHVTVHPRIEREQWDLAHQHKFKFIVRRIGAYIRPWESVAMMHKYYITERVFGPFIQFYLTFDASVRGNIQRVGDSKLLLIDSRSDLKAVVDKERVINYLQEDLTKEGLKLRAWASYVYPIEEVDGVFLAIRDATPILKVLPNGLSTRLDDDGTSMDKYN